MAGTGRELFRIGELAARSGCSRRQIQDFLVMGLIKAEQATAGGQHLFGEATVRRLKLIRQVLASGGKEYTMAELIRTFRKFLQAVVLVASLAWAVAPAGATARAAESAPDTPAYEAALKAADRAGIRELMDKLCDVMRKGEADRIYALLAAGAPQQRVQTIYDKLQAEFNSYSYRDFSWEPMPQSVEVLGPGRVRLSVIIRWEYEDKSEPERVQTDSVGQAFEFDLVREKDEWRIAGDNFFDRLSASQNAIFSRIFLWTALGLVVFSFWGWMLLDSCFREWGGRRGPWVTAMILALLVGVGAIVVAQLSAHKWLLALAPTPAAAALVYFFAVWMRQGPED